MWFTEDCQTKIRREAGGRLSKFTYIDLFAGIGGFRQALDNLGGHCVFASEIDKFASKAYETLYGHKPTGDITQIDAKDVPDHDLLVGGFPYI